MKNFGFVLRSTAVEVVAGERRCDADERRHARILGANRQRDPRAERHAGRPERRTRILRRHVVESGAIIVLFAGTVAERSLAGAGAAEVDAQHRAADPAQRLRRLIDDLGVHRAALRGQRVREHDRRAQAAGVSLADAAVVADGPGRRRLFEQRFEPAGRSGELTRRHGDGLRVNARRRASANASGRVIDPRCPVRSSTAARAFGISRR